MTSQMLHSGFMLTALRQPGRVAVISEGVAVTYGELLQRSLRMAALIDSTARASVRPVAIAGDKSVDSIVCILATLISGRAYSVLNPAQRTARLIKMAASLRPSLVIDLGSTETDYDAAAIACGAPILRLPTAMPDQGIEPQTVPTRCAYTLFTSGSSGAPKGVMIGHAAATIAQQAFLAHVGLHRDDVVANEVALSFDVSTFDLHATFAVGGTVVLASETTLTRPAELLEHLTACRATWLFTVPTVMRFLLQASTSASARLSTLRVGLTGELISSKTAQLLKPMIASGNVHNLYGGTEFPWSLSRKLQVSDVKTPNVVDAIPNKASSFELSATGEVVLNGAGLATGYVSPDVDFDAPFVPQVRYATGDIATDHGNGLLRIIGRNDRQLRISGHRIELAEIEAAIEEHPAVELCYARHEVQTDTITATVSVKTRKVSSSVERQLRHHAQRVLPDYMVPARFDVTTSAPRTVTGKKIYA